MKVLIATGIFPPEIGGPATYAALLVEELKKRGDEAVVLPFRVVKRYPRWLRHLVYFIEILKKGWSSDLIFTQDPVSTGFPSLIAARLTGKKVVMRIAGDHAWEQSRQQWNVTDSIDDFQKRKYSPRVELTRLIQKFSVTFADIVVTPSKYFRGIVSSWVKGSREVLTIYNGINLDVEYVKEAKYPEKTIISAGRLVPWKGFDTLIRALKDMPGWRLRIAGDGPDKARLEGIIKEEGVSDRVQFLGQLPHPQLFAAIHRSHVFALLATFESFSFQVVEAMHVGIPVVAARIGNLAEIIDDGVNGVLIEPLNIQALKSFCEKVVSDTSFAAKISAAGQRRAAFFSIEKTFDQLHAVFEQLANSKK